MHLQEYQSQGDSQMGEGGGTSHSVQSAIGVREHGLGDQGEKPKFPMLVREERSSDWSEGEGVLTQALKAEPRENQPDGN